MMYPYQQLRCLRIVTAMKTSKAPAQTTVAKEPYWKPSKKTVSPADMEAFAARLRQRRLELGMTNSDLAKEAFGTYVDANGVEHVKDREKIGMWEKGEGLPGETKMRDLARALRWTLKELAPPIAAPSAMPSKALPIDVQLQPKTEEGVWIKPQRGGLALLTVCQRMSLEDAAMIAAQIAKIMKHGH
jgi:transcriptional regulator with XRE-family HTH domain